MLPEGEEDRIIKAADYLLEREIVNLIIVGDKNAILARGEELGLKFLDRARFQAMDDENVLKPMVAKLCELRAKKGMTEEQARKQLADASYFGTMLVVLATPTAWSPVPSIPRPTPCARPCRSSRPSQVRSSFPAPSSCASRITWPCLPTVPST